MQNVYYLKLVSGEDVITKIDDVQADSIDLVMEHPMLVEYYSTDDRTYAAGLRPWIPGLSDLEEFTIDAEHVMIMCEVGEKLAGYYDIVVERNKSVDYEHVTEDEESEVETERVKMPHSNTIH